MRRSYLNILWSLLLPALATATDTTTPLLIEADHMELAQRSGISHYQGNVTLQQGGLRMSADSIILYSSGNKQLQRIVATGSPATLQQPKEEQKGALRAEATQMEYLPEQQVVILQGGAKLWQNGNEFSGEKIHYDLQQRQFKASGNGQEKGRVRVLLQPQEKASTEKQP